MNSMKEEAQKSAVRFFHLFNTCILGNVYVAPVESDGSTSHQSHNPHRPIHTSTTRARRRRPSRSTSGRWRRRRRPRRPGRRRGRRRGAFICGVCIEESVCACVCACMEGPRRPARKGARYVVVCMLRVSTDLVGRSTGPRLIHMYTPSITTTGGSCGRRSGRRSRMGGMTGMGRRKRRMGAWTLRSRRPWGSGASSKGGVGVVCV